MPFEKVKFEYNEVQEITLRHPAGRIVNGKFGQQVYYTLADGRGCYLNLDVAQKLNMLEPQAGETICICKRTSKIWDVWLSPETEKFRAMSSNGGMEEQLRASVSAANEKRYNGTLRVPVLVPPASNGGSNGAACPAPAVHTAAPITESSRPDTRNHNTRPSLADEATQLVDAFAKVLEYSLTTYSGRVKPDDVRSLLLSCYIGRQKAGNV